MLRLVLSKKRCACPRARDAWVMALCGHDGAIAPRMVVMRHCSGSSLVMELVKGAMSTLCSCSKHVSLGGLDETEALNPMLNAYVSRDGLSMSDAMDQARLIAQRRNNVLLFKGSAELLAGPHSDEQRERCERAKCDAVWPSLVAARTRAVVVQRDPLGVLLCLIRDGFKESEWNGQPTGWVVDAAGKRVPSAFRQRSHFNGTSAAPQMVHLEAEAASQKLAELRAQQASEVNLLRRHGFVNVSLPIRIEHLTHYLHDLEHVEGSARLWLQLLGSLDCFPGLDAIKTHLRTRIRSRPSSPAPKSSSQLVANPQILPMVAPWEEWGQGQARPRAEKPRGQGHALHTNVT